jgi:hypothetical protein
MDDWDENDPPRKGQVILLAGVREFSNGWRAKHAQPKKLTM